MGLDGLSINNLGLNRDNTSKESSINSESLANTRGLYSNSIDQLGKKEAITSEDHDNPSFSGGFTEDEETDELKDVYENEDGEEEVLKEPHYPEYIFEIDSTEKIIHITDKETKQHITDITVEDLSKFISSMKQPSGIIINRKI